MPKKLYQCTICNEIYEDFEEAQTCEDDGVREAKHSVGDKLILKLNYPENDGRTTEEVEIIKIVPFGHTQGYKLNKIVQIGKTCYVGFDRDRSDNSSTCVPLTDEYLGWCEAD